MSLSVCLKPWSRLTMWPLTQTSQSNSFLIPGCLVIKASWESSPKKTPENEWVNKTFIQVVSQRCSLNSSVIHKKGGTMHFPRLQIINEAKCKRCDNDWMLVIIFQQHLHKEAFCMTLSQLSHALHALLNESRAVWGVSDSTMVQPNVTLNQEMIVCDWLGKNL